MGRFATWIFGTLIVILVGFVPVVHFRWVYNHGRRLREVTAGVMYRSGQLTSEGFRQAVETFGIKTIVNLQDDFPDPLVHDGYFPSGQTRESDLCRELGVRFVFIAPDLIPRPQLAERRPTAIDQFLRLMDDPEAYPVLIHCKAGLHRTGILTAVYRMEYQGWDYRQAIAEMKANGFATWPCTSSNDYIFEYLLAYQRGVRQPQTLVQRP